VQCSRVACLSMKEEQIVVQEDRPIPGRKTYRSKLIVDLLDHEQVRTKRKQIQAIMSYLNGEGEKVCFRYPSQGAPHMANMLYAHPPVDPPTFKLAKSLFRFERGDLAFAAFSSSSCTHYAGIQVSLAHVMQACCNFHLLHYGR